MDRYPLEPSGRHAGGSEPPWQPFVRRLRAFIASRVPAQEVDDVSQDVLLRLHRGAAKLRDERKAQAWVYRIARHAIADFYRARGKRDATREIELESIEDPTAMPAEHLASFDGDHDVHEEVLSWLRPMAEELPEKYRRPLLMADFDGLPQREVARRLDLSLSGAKSRVQRARRLLAKELGSCCEVVLSAEGQVEDFMRRNCECLFGCRPRTP